MSEGKRCCLAVNIHEYGLHYFPKDRDKASQQINQQINNESRAWVIVGGLAVFVDVDGNFYRMCSGIVFLSEIVFPKRAVSAFQQI